MVRTTVRQHATLPTAVGFTIVAQLTELGVDTATSVDKGFGVVPKRVIRTMTVETTTLVAPKDLTFRGVHNGTSGVLKDSET